MRRISAVIVLSMTHSITPLSCYGLEIDLFGLYKNPVGLYKKIFRPLHFVFFRYCFWHHCICKLLFITCQCICVLVQCIESSFYIVPISFLIIFNKLIAGSYKQLRNVYQESLDRLWSITELWCFFYVKSTFMLYVWMK